MQFKGLGVPQQAFCNANGVCIDRHIACDVDVSVNFFASITSIIFRLVRIPSPVLAYLEKMI